MKARKDNLTFEEKKELVKLFRGIVKFILEEEEDDM